MTQRVFAEQPLKPIRILAVTERQHEVGAFVPFAQFGAQRDAPRRLQFLKMVLNGGQVLVAQFSS